MARKPNYGFERKERERSKAAKVAERVKAKAVKPDTVQEEAGKNLPSDPKEGS